MERSEVGNSASDGIYSGIFYKPLGGKPYLERKNSRL